MNDLNIEINDNRMDVEYVLHEGSMGLGFEKDKKDLTLKFHGSSNQRVIDVHKTLEQGKICLWTM